MRSSELERYWKASFDRTASDSSEDAAAAQWSEHGLQRRFNLFTKLCQKYSLVTNEKIFLDAGCGPGMYSSYLISGGSRVVSVDFSEQMITRARSKLSRELRMRSDDVFALVASVDKLPLRSSSIDVVVCFGVLQHTSDREAVFRELFRVCKPGAHCLINTLNTRFLFAKKDGMLVTHDPIGLRKLSEVIGFKYVTNLPMLLFPRPLRFLETLDNIQWIHGYLWFAAHSFTLVLRKPE